MNKEKISKRQENTNINIGAYYLAPYARTEAHIKDAATCGIDFFINIPNNSSLLGLLHNYRIGAIVTTALPNWFGNDGSNAGQLAETNPIDVYQTALDSFVDAPNIIGIDTGDEPSALDFKHYGRIFDLLQENLPHLQPYLNLYPSYALKGSNTPEEIEKQLRTETYEAYIDTFCKNVNSDYICFDYYLYSAKLDGLYHSLKTVSSACKAYHRDLWMVLQVNSHLPDVWVSINQLRFQAYTAMAFGAKNIIWACYTAGWWHNHVLDREGNKTEQYEKLKKVNSEIHFLGNEYINYQYKQTHFLGNHCVATVDSQDSLSTSFVSDFKAEHNEALIVGEMQSSSANALFVCAADDCYDKQTVSFSVSFKTPNRNVILFKNETRTPLVSNKGGIFTISLCSNEGALLTFDS